MDINDMPEEAPKRKGGWPKGKPRGNRVPLREAPHEAPQAPIRAESGRAAAKGRDGEILTRKRPTNHDIFYIPPDIIPDGWDYQWNTVEVLGREEVAQQLAMAENGWRPVPAGRHPGMFMPAGYSTNGPIIRDGLRLEERPIALTMEAREDEQRKADRQVRDQHEQLGLAQRMPNGFSRDNPNLRRMERSGTSRSYAPAPDAPRPQYSIDPT